MGPEEHMGIRLPLRFARRAKEHVPCLWPKEEGLNLPRKTNTCPLQSSTPLDHSYISGVNVEISALTGEGMETLLLAIEGLMEQGLDTLTVKLPYGRGDLVSLFHERGQVSSENHLADGVVIYGRLPSRLIPYFQEYQFIQD